MNSFVLHLKLVKFDIYPTMHCSYVRNSEFDLSRKHQPQPYSVAADFSLGLGALFAMFILLFSKILEDPAKACESGLLTAEILKCINVN